MLKSEDRLNKTKKNLSLEDLKCTICYEANLSPIKYFNCSITHNICDICFKKHVSNIGKIRSGTCPTCSASLKIQYKEPINLTVAEIHTIKIQDLSLGYIHIHQNFKLQDGTSIIKIILNSEEISFHCYNGKIMTYKGMFVAQNGFLYDFDNLGNNYHLSIIKNKYQLWDCGRITLQL